MILFLVLFFILGSAVGSFLNVVVDRAIRKESFFLGRSYCDHCRARLFALDLVPILSFAVLGARCRYCRKPLSWQYPAVEALCGFLFALTFYSLVDIGKFSLWSLVFTLFVICTLIVVSVIDLKYSLIPTTFVFGASLIVLFYNFLLFPSDIFVSSVLIAFVLAFSFAAIVFLTGGRGMGSGDIPLVFLIGLFLGWPDAIVGLFLAFVSGAFVSVILLILRKKKFGQTIPFGPFLVFGTQAAFFVGERFLNWYLSFI